MREMLLACGTIRSGDLRPYRICIKGATLIMSQPIRPRSLARRSLRAGGRGRTLPRGLCLSLSMIARHWRGWTKTEDADAYETLLKDKVLPGLSNIPGYRGGYLLRNQGTEEAEFVVINLFESMDAVRQFAGPDFAVPVFEPEAKKLLSRFEPVANHYEVRVSKEHQDRLAERED